MKFSRLRFSPEERMKIAREYLENDLPAAEVAKNYGIGKRTLDYWIKNLRMSEKKCNFVLRKYVRRPQERSEVPTQMSEVTTKEADMQTKSVEELERELAKVKKELAEEKLRVLALNTLIDVAEEHGYRIRKKSGAKQ